MLARVLVLQEKEDNIRNIAECLPDCKITNVDTVHQAYSALQSQNFNLIISAVHLEYDESVFDFLEECKRHPKSKDIPFVFYCARTSTFARSVRHGLEIAAGVLGADKYITMEKFDMQKLRSEILKVLFRQTSMIEGGIVRAPIIETMDKNWAPG